MRCGAVVALVEVIGENLPVVVALEFVRVVEGVFVEIDALVPILDVDVGEVFVPRDFWGVLAGASVMHAFEQWERKRRGVWLPLHPC
jgi:hypothetical protein